MSTQIADKLRAKIHELTDLYLDADVRRLRASNMDDESGYEAAAEAKIYLLRGTLATLRRAHVHEVVEGSGMSKLHLAIDSAEQVPNEEAAIRLRAIIAEIQR